MLLFNARSPFIDDYLETCWRRGLVLEGIVCTDDRPARVADRRSLIGLAEAIDRFPGAAVLACAFDVRRREALVAQATSLGFVPAEPLIDPTAVTATSTRIGAGSYVNATAVIGGMTHVGEHVIVNRSASLGHHVVVDDFVSLGPGVVVPSAVRIGRGAALGAGAIVLPGTTIGTSAVVAAGTVVRRAVPDGCLAFGAPMRIRKMGCRRFMASDDQE